MTPRESVCVLVAAIGLGTAVAVAAAVGDCDPEQAQRLLRAAEGQLTFQAWDRAAALLADADPCLENPIERWRAHVLEVAIELARGARHLGVLDRHQQVTELRDLLATHDDPSGELPIRTLVVIAGLSDRSGAEKAYRRAIHLAAADPSAFDRLIAEILAAYGHLHDDHGGGCSSMPGATPKSVLLEIADLDLGERARAAWWEQVVAALESMHLSKDASEVEARRRLVEVVRRMARDASDDVPAEALLLALRSDASPDEALFHALLSRPDIDERERESVRQRLTRRNEPQLRLLRRDVPVTSSQPVRLDIVHQNLDTDTVTVECVPLELSEEKVPRPGLEPTEVAGYYRVAGPSIRRHELTLPSGEQRSAVELPPLPAGAWRLQAESGQVTTAVDVVATDLTWLLWTAGDSCRLAVVEPVSGRPRPAARVRIGAIAGTRLEWRSDVLTSDELGTVELAAGACSSGPYVVALESSGHWLAWSQQPYRSPPKASPESSAVDSLLQCFRAESWVQLVLEGDALRRAEPLGFDAIVTSFAEPACRPTQLGWTVVGAGTRRTVASGTVSLDDRGIAHGQVVPDDDWPDGAYEISLSTVPGSGPMASSWRLGRLGRDNRPAIAVEFAPQGSLEAGATPLSVRISQVGGTSIDAPLRLTVSEFAIPWQFSFQLPPVANVHAVGSASPSPSQGGPRLLLDRHVDLTAGFPIEVGLAGLELETATLLAVVRTADSLGEELAAAAVDVTRGPSARVLTLEFPRWLDADAAATPAMVTARMPDGHPITSGDGLRLEVRSWAADPTARTVSDYPVTLDGSGRGVVRVPLAPPDSAHMVADDGAMSPLASPNAVSRAPRRDETVWLTSEPAMVEAGGTAEIAIHSPGNGAFAVLTVGRDLVRPVVLDSHEVRVAVRLPAEDALHVGVSLLTVRDGQPLQAEHTIPIRRPAVDAWRFLPLRARRLAGEAGIAVEPPVALAETRWLSGSIVWPPYHGSHEHPGVPIPASGHVRALSLEAVPPPPSRRPSRTTAATPRAVTTPAARPTPRPQETVTWTISPVPVVPLAPARLLCRFGPDGRSEAPAGTCREAADAATAVVVSSAEHRFQPRFVAVDPH